MNQMLRCAHASAQQMQKKASGLHALKILDDAVVTKCFLRDFVCSLSLKKAANVQGVPKMTQFVFCRNFVKSPANLIIFVTQIAKMI